MIIYRKINVIIILNIKFRSLTSESILLPAYNLKKKEKHFENPLFKYKKSTSVVPVEL